MFLRATKHSGINQSCSVFFCGAKGEMLELGNKVFTSTWGLWSLKVVWRHFLCNWNRWPRTWRMFLHSDRDGAGRRAARSSWCCVLSLPQPAGKSPWSWPAAPACTQWIFWLPLNCRRGSPTGTKRLREIWVRKNPGGDVGFGEVGGVWKAVISMIILQITANPPNTGDPAAS